MIPKELILNAKTVVTVAKAMIMRGHTSPRAKQHATAAKTIKNKSTTTFAAQPQFCAPRASAGWQLAPGPLPARNPGHGVGAWVCGSRRVYSTLGLQLPK